MSELVERRRGWDALLTGAWWLHPFLFAAVPIVFLFAHNVREQLSLDPLLEPLGLALGAAAVLLAALSGLAILLRREPARAALVATLAIVLFMTYGHAWNAAGPLLGIHRNLLLVWGALGLVGAVLAARAPISAVRAVTGGLNVIGLILLVINAIPIADHQLRVASVVGGAPAAEADPSVQGESPAHDRDVWYLVFDRYASASVLEEVYGLDNSDFIAELRALGFYVADRSTANYLKTAHSLASALSADYLDQEALRAEAAAPDDWTPLYRRLQGAYPLQEFLDARGYTYLHLGVRRGATVTNSAADREFVYSGQTEFSTTLRETTLLEGLDHVFRPGGSFVPGGVTGLYGLQTLYQLRTLEELAETAGGRRYVFAHLLVPHPPYLFHADGSWVTPEEAEGRTDEQGYAEQVRFVNNRLRALLDILLDRPREEWPIIILMADEGPFPRRYAEDEEGFDWRRATPDELFQKFGILTAVLLPDAGPKEAGLYPEITPVNVIRAVLRAEFGAELPPLPDRNWIFTDQRHLYDFVDATERVPRQPPG
ncbi:MAG TPA: hypothetical protein VFH63_11130 [candidate division Zixibacteria bacterium]|nr:hypothetical protein [candidate division Zixibacteria bacterium]